MDSKAPRFILDDLLESDVLDLPDQEGRHAMQVLRMQSGDTVELTDGKGNLAIATITHAGKKHCSVAVHERLSEQPIEPAVTLAIAPVKSMDRMGWLLEKLTEVGISRIIPVITDRSERRSIRSDKAIATMQSALKQSRRCWLPEWQEPVSFADFWKQQNENVFFAHCMAGEKQLLSRCVPPGQPCTILIGPEGDFTPEELQLALENKAIPVSLGEQRLRTETAALQAVITVHLLNGKL